MRTEVFCVATLDRTAQAHIAYAAEAIRAGKLVVFPTETVYGLGADGTNAAAASSIYAAKGRPSDNPLILHIAEPEDAKLYAQTGPLYDRLAEAFMPGPLTVVLPAKPTVPLATRGGLPTVAIRCPDHPVANLLIALSRVPIAAPSANLSGTPSPTNAQHVIDDMQGRVDVILDGGDSSFGLESTIVKLEEDGTMTLLRPGKITPEQLSQIAPLHISTAVTGQLQHGETAPSPGMKYRHYAPSCPLTLLDGPLEAQMAYISTHSCGKIGIIGYSEDLPLLRAGFPHAVLYDFGAKGDELSQAHALFYILREADKDRLRSMFAPLPRVGGIGLALYNRMIRAAAHHIVSL